jgi:hypothetical protein
MPITRGDGRNIVNGLVFWMGGALGIGVGFLACRLQLQWLRWRDHRQRAALRRLGYVEADADTLRTTRDAFAFQSVDELTYPDTVVSDASEMLSELRAGPQPGGPGREPPG